MIKPMRFAWLGIGIADVALAAVIRVPAHQPTIQAGIDAAAAGDTVLVAPGTYSGRGNKRLSFYGVDRVLVSQAGASRTVIDAEDSGRCIKFRNGETRASVVWGFTFSNGYSVYSAGGGVCCEGSSPRIINCVICRNTTDGEGGGVACKNCSPILTNCRIVDNVSGGVYCYHASPTFGDCTISDNRDAYSGGGISCSSYSDPTLVNCTISNNNSWDGGGGLSCYSNCAPTLENCTIWSNTAQRHSGAICCRSSSPRLVNCTIAGNSSSVGSGGLACLDQSSPELLSCILWGNGPQELALLSGTAAVRYSDVLGGWPGLGNIDADPRFCSALCGYYYDLGLAANSPCLKTGYEGADMGAYGGPGNWRWLLDTPPRPRTLARRWQ